MNKFTFSLFTAAILFITAIFIPQSASAASFQNGTYDVPYEIKDAGGASTSIADGYFLKPAKVTVENGKYYAQFSVKNAEWIKSVSGPYGAATVVSEDKANDRKVLKLQVSDISSPVDLSMHIVVPEDVAGMEYDNNHKAKAVFNTSGIPTGSSTTSDSSGTSDASGKAPTTPPEDNPKTSDEAPIILFALLFVGAGVLLVRRMVVTEK